MLTSVYNPVSLCDRSLSLFTISSLMSSVEKGFFNIHLISSRMKTITYWLFFNITKMFVSVRIAESYIPLMKCFQIIHNKGIVVKETTQHGHIIETLRRLCSWYSWFFPQEVCSTGMWIKRTWYYGPHWNVGNEMKTSARMTQNICSLGSQVGQA